MSNNFSKTAAQILAEAADDSQMLQEDAASHPALAQIVTGDAQALKTALAGQDNLYKNNPALGKAVQATHDNVAPDEPQTSTGLDIPKGIG